MLDVLDQCGEDKEVKTLLLEGLFGEMLVVIVHSNTTFFVRKAWLKSVNLML